MAITTSLVSGTASPVLIIGATGFIGQFVAEASLATGRTTYFLVRTGSFTNPTKANIIKALEEKGATVIHGSLRDRKFLERKMRELEIGIVISAIAGDSILDQITLIEAIQAVDSVQRFLPSEFGHDLDRSNPVEPALAMYNEKRKVREAVEAAGIPYTYICCNSIASWPYHDNTHPSELPPPLDKFKIYGDGSVKAYFVAGTDIGKFTMKTVDDARTLNKIVHFRPSGNLFNMNELSALWEKKIGRTLPRVTVTECDLLTAAEENRIPESIVASLTHDIFINGCQVNFSLDRPTDVEITSLYPGIPFISVDDCFGNYVVDFVNEPEAADEIKTPNPMVEKMVPIAATCA